jgi:hypothetical protein
MSEICQDGQRGGEGMSSSINEAPHTSHSEKSAACGLHESTLCAPHSITIPTPSRGNRIAIKTTNGKSCSNLVKLKTRIDFDFAARFSVVYITIKVAKVN